MPLIGEIKDLQKIKTITGSTRIEGGLSGDDRFMAQCINLYALHRMAILGFEKKSWEERKEEENKIELQQFTGYDFEKTTALTPNGFDAMVDREAREFYYSSLEDSLGYDW
jgi:hypothetical protein